MFHENSYYLIFDIALKPHNLDLHLPDFIILRPIYRFNS